MSLLYKIGKKFGVTGHPRDLQPLKIRANRLNIAKTDMEHLWLNFHRTKMTEVTHCFILESLMSLFYNFGIHFGGQRPSKRFFISANECKQANFSMNIGKMEIKLLWLYFHSINKMTEHAYCFILKSLMSRTYIFEIKVWRSPSIQGKIIPFYDWLTMEAETYHKKQCACMAKFDINIFLKFSKRIY